MDERQPIFATVQHFETPDHVDLCQCVDLVALGDDGLQPRHFA